MFRRGSIAAAPRGVARRAPFRLPLPRVDGAAPPTADEKRAFHSGMQRRVAAATPDEVAAQVRDIKFRLRAAGATPNRDVTAAAMNPPNVWFIVVFLCKPTAAGSAGSPCNTRHPVLRCAACAVSIPVRLCWTEAAAGRTMSQSPRLLWAATAVNFVTYSTWTMLNKLQFTVPPPRVAGAGGAGAHAAPWREGFGVAVPLLVTGLQMALAGCCAAFCIFALGIQRRPPAGAGVSRRLYDELEGGGGGGDDEPVPRDLPPPPLFSLDTLRRKIVPLGLARSVDIGGANAALVTVSVAVQQVVKSLLPIFVSLLSATVLGKRVPPQVWLSLVPIVGGTVCATWGDTHCRLLGVAFAAVSCLARAFKCVLNAKLLQPTRTEAPMRPLEILLLEAPTSGVFLLAVSLLVEAGPYRAQLPHLLAALPLNLLGGGLMFLNSASYIVVIEQSSAVSCQVIMNVKMLLLILVSVHVFHTPLSALNYGGVAVATAGCVAYAVLSSAAPRRKEPSNIV
jgi:drug/metabolite transporter (DMT)-like permease